MKKEAREKTSGFQAGLVKVRACVFVSCLYRAPNMRERERGTLTSICALRTVRKSRDARSHGPPEATDGSTDKRPQSHYVRERNAGLHGQFNGDPDLLSVFNDRQSAANRQNGSINPP